MKLTSTGQKTVRVLGGLAVILVVGLGLRYAAMNGYGREILGSVVPDKIEGLDAGTDALVGGAEFAGSPATSRRRSPALPRCASTSGRGTPRWGASTATAAR
jgi:hypothetical protein